MAAPATTVPTPWYIMGEGERELLTLGAHAQKGYNSVCVCGVCVCVCVCVSVCYHTRRLLVQSEVPMTHRMMY